jgi:SAM-dependent methyltransferase
LRVNVPVPAPVTTYERYVDWDVRNWAAAPAFWERHTRLDLSGAHCLEIGSRDGGLSQWLAERGARVVCSDLSSPAPRARDRHRASGVSHRIRYRGIDATQFDSRNVWDLIVFKSVLGALGGADRRAVQADAISRMHRALRAGGELFFAENLVASPAHRLLRRRFVPWGRRWGYVSVAELRHYLAPFPSVEYETRGFAGTFGRSQAQRRLLGRLDRAGLDRLVPSTWRYIMMGIARK